MDFNWSAISGAVAPLAPKLGAVLGGIVGGPIGSTIGGLAGSALAAAFGVEETPEAVGKAITERPDAAEVIRQVEADQGETIRQEALVKIKALEEETAQTKIYADDTNEARKMQLALLEQGSALSWGASVLATVFIIAFFVLFSIVITTDVKENPILMAFVGTLTAGVIQILSFFFGSSAGSKSNADRFANLASQVANKPNPSPAVIEAVKAASGKKK